MCMMTLTRCGTDVCAFQVHNNLKVPLFEGFYTFNWVLKVFNTIKHQLHTLSTLSLCLKVC